MRIVAIVSAFNEADVIAHVVGDLIEQGVQVYFLDDGSTDGTVAAVEPYVGRGVLAIERMAPGNGSTPQFDWERILRRKTELARGLDADWFIHHDADEFRESPWPHLSLREAMRMVDALGFNAIDSTRLDFWPVHDGFRPGDDVRGAFTHWAPPAAYDRLQIRCWKRTEAPVDLVGSGGHEVRFPGRRVFPIRFLLRHYPIRGQAHGERKVFRERRPRYTQRERARGWHVQLSLLERHRGVDEAEASAALRVELERVRRHAEATAAEVARLRDVVEDGARRLAELHASLSWRLTAPARAAGRLLRGR